MKLQTTEKVDTMSFSQALDAMEKGHKVCREGWSGKIKFSFIANSISFYKETKKIKVDLNTTQLVCVNLRHHMPDNIIVGWSIPQEDILAEDWMIIE